MGWFWADRDPDPSFARDHPTSGSPRASCPVHRRDSAAVEPPSSCPYTPEENDNNSDKSLNPLNLMFSALSQLPSIGQKMALPTEREVSSIPKGSPGESGNWEYPSPQQMYNAMRRKGYDDAPEDAVEGMVTVHNWLNEGAWAHIVDWERKFSGGVLAHLKGETREAGEEAQPKLLRFQGRKSDVSPKARMYGFLGRLMPETYGGPPPFDRHDWYVLRPRPEGEEPQEVRYVIDYYSGPPEPNGNPVFYLDVRPALDSPTLVAERVAHWVKEVWDRASGMDVRRKAQEEKLNKDKDM